MAQREDGFFDIYDLKTAALDRMRITKGEQRRRRFIDYIEEGIAQLAHYREYFTFEGNCQIAEKKYGIKVRNPRLTLIAGNIENADVREVTEACRRYPEIALLDYDTLAQLFFGVSADAQVLDNAGDSEAAGATPANPSANENLSG
jgi:hypothetical protein